MTKFKKFLSVLFLAAALVVAPIVPESASASVSATYLIAAGGAGGSAGATRQGGAGAGGAVNSGTVSLTSGTSYPIVVGTGGGANTSGGDSSAFGVTSTGGGHGGNSSNVAGTSGGSGGGGSGGTSSGVQGAGGSGSTGGNNGGAGFGSATANSRSGGGGGGANGTGSAGASTVGGKGGDGIASSISGASVTYGAGGGGGGTTGGAGGSGGGGAGGSAVAGHNGTGIGSGGGGGSSAGGSSGTNGQVIMSVPTGTFAYATYTGSATVTTSGGNDIYTFNTSGTFIPHDSTDVPNNGITFVNAQSGGLGANKPVGLAVGDLMIASIAADSNITSGPSGFSNIAFTFNPLNDYYVYYKIADAGDVAATDFTWTTSSGGGFTVIAAFRGTSSAVPTVGSANAVSNTGSPLFSNDVTPTKASSMIIMALGYIGNTFGGAPNSFGITTSNPILPAWTLAGQSVDVNFNGTSIAYVTQRFETTATGAYFTSGAGATTDWNSFIISVEPAAALVPFVKTPDIIQMF